MSMSTSASKQQPFSSKPSKNPNPITYTHSDAQNPNLPSNTKMSLVSNSPTLFQDVVLSRASHLTRQELLKRRLQHLNQLSKCYRDHYWALMEDLRIQYREYYWRFGVSPFKHDHNQEPGGGIDANPTNNIEGSDDNVNNSINVNVNNSSSLDFKINHRCLFVGCKFKAMALTSFCHLHILSDSKQKLYKACTYVIKSAHAGPITCGKPILRSTIPSLCAVHFQKAQKHVNRALKKAGLNVSSSSKLASKFHVIVAEYVHQIQAKRRAAPKGITSKATIEEESAS
ncbi:INO80 complex subunit D-like [Durio zibethinus]|uniref:KAT8 regulatory NSL complex subunit 2 n=1 Tax=Durio zibethinus TaxID=66656 RepID=A0A6P6ASK5_DURZI|nr:INO80 complex subunit D-like [Durio zibethinus]XP_022767855.1 INO80 complex subunit D-like [Durio zibethinus]XP_022767856.1 INO80 complex subunit D-like [Durio zibethinus]